LIFVTFFVLVLLPVFLSFSFYRSSSRSRHCRETIDRYSYVAPLSEIAENDYNLNIPRYVDTFEEEDAVDLTAVTSALQALEADMAETDSTIAGFCKELGIPSPFNS
jgi:type I restriction enzyme M protein